MKAVRNAMRRTSLVFLALALLGAVAHANPIPVPPPASMPLEEMWVDITHSGAGLHADFYGEFTFDYIPAEVEEMWFPVPEDSINIHTGQDGTPLTWAWDSHWYETALPECPAIPMIGWDGPFPTDGAVFSVQYAHDLVVRPDEFIFLYALGTGQYFPTYEKITEANFHITLPMDVIPTIIWLDEIQLGPEHYTLSGSSLEISISSEFGPFIRDLFIHLVARIPGDATGEGIVDADDAALLAQNWGETDATWEMGDFDGDQFIGPADAAILAANWGQGTDAVDPGIVPEPCGFALLAAGAVILATFAARRRQRPERRSTAR